MGKFCFCGAIFGDHGRGLKIIAATVVAGAVVYKAVSAIRGKLAASAFQKEIASFDKKVVHLYAMPRFSKGPGMSGPCLKVESYLRLAKIPYVMHFTMNMNNSPTGRLPMIVLGGEVTADSTFIIQRLEKEFNVKIDAELSEEQQAHAICIRRVVEGNLMWCNYRCMMVDNIHTLKDFMTSELGLPSIAAGFAANNFRKQMINTLNTIGNGDLTDEQYRHEHLVDMKALELILSKHTFAFGDSPTTTDCIIYAYLNFPFHLQGIDNNPANAYLKQSKVFKQFMDSFEAAVFPNLDKIISYSKGKGSVDYLTF